MDCRTWIAGLIARYLLLDNIVGYWFSESVKDAIMKNANNRGKHVLFP